MRTINILNPIEISIESFEIDSKDVAWYKIIIKTSDRTWSVLKRYSEFDALHSNIKSKIKGVKIPPKKIRKSEDFLQSRKNELEKYLNEVIQEVGDTVPMDLVTFLKLDCFEPYSIVSDLALTLQKVLFRNEILSVIVKIEKIDSFIFASTERALFLVSRFASLPRSSPAVFSTQDRQNKGLIKKRPSSQQPIAGKTRVQRGVFYGSARTFITSLLRGEYFWIRPFEKLTESAVF